MKFNLFSKPQRQAEEYLDEQDMGDEIVEYPPYEITTLSERRLQINEGALGIVQNVTGLYSQCCEIKAKTEQVKAWSEVKITETIAKYKSCQDFLSFTFGERDKALSKHYDLLDKAVETGDKDLIIAALSGISGIVTSSPLSDFDKFVELYQDTNQPLLDF